MIRDAHARSLIFDIDTAIQALVERDWRSRNGHIDWHYRNLIRNWAEV